MKNFLLVLLGIAIGAGAFFLFNLTQSEKQKSSPLTGPARYNCELSSGTFENGTCSCILEGNQTQEEMYDETTGFCQSTIGGPASAAFPASVGLPYGDYGYWNNIIFNLCTQSGGYISGVSCTCPAETTYDETTGQCQ